MKESISWFLCFIGFVILALVCMALLDERQDTRDVTNHRLRVLQRDQKSLESRVKTLENRIELPLIIE